MSADSNDSGDGSMMIQQLRDDLERGLRFTHIALTVNQEQGSEAVAYFQALVDVLVKHNLIQEDDLEEPLERA
ncbi:MAG: hypothetical protein ACYC6L_11355, partial [Anaerolineae bacterium]